MAKVKRKSGEHSHACCRHCPTERSKRTLNRCFVVRKLDHTTDRPRDRPDDPAILYDGVVPTGSPIWMDVSMAAFRAVISRKSSGRDRRDAWPCSCRRWRRDRARRSGRAHRSARHVRSGVRRSASGHRLRADVVGTRRGDQLGAREPLVRIRHAAESARSRGEGAESRAAGRVQAGGFGLVVLDLGGGRAAGHQAAAVHDVAAAASGDRRQRNRVRADWARSRSRAARAASACSWAGPKPRRSKPGALCIARVVRSRAMEAIAMFACLYLPPPVNSSLVRAEGRG